jgi:hypothetical protein
MRSMIDYSGFISTKSWGTSPVLRCGVGTVGIRCMKTHLCCYYEVIRRYVPHYKLLVAQLVEKIPALSETQGFIIVFGTDDFKFRERSHRTYHISCRSECWWEFRVLKNCIPLRMEAVCSTETQVTAHVATLCRDTAGNLACVNLHRCGDCWPFLLLEVIYAYHLSFFF